MITILLAEPLHVSFGPAAAGWDNLLYGLLLVVFIIFLPQGILGSVMGRCGVRRPCAPYRSDRLPL